VIVPPDATPEIENALISINAKVTFIRLFNSITTGQSSMDARIPSMRKTLSIIRPFDRASANRFVKKFSERSLNARRLIPTHPFLIRNISISLAIRAQQTFSNQTC
jgi:hypothetical protein